MLFHSTEFLFYFLPLTWLGFVVLVKAGRYRIVLAWLTLASLVFYAWWNPCYIWLILASISVNFTLSRLVRPASRRDQRARIRILCAWESAARYPCVSDGKAGLGLRHVAADLSVHFA